MLVHETTIVKEAGEVCITVRLELEKKLAFLPKELWYKFPEAYEQYISPRADAFAPTALLLAMYTGEDLTIRGPISPKLAYGLFEYRNIFHSWLPKLFQKVEINYEQLQPVKPIPGETAVAAAFSGGVDSFYTLWSHLQENQEFPHARLTHGIFVRGLDMRLDDEENYLKAAEQYTNLYKELGLDLILASTNAYQFSEFRIDWTLFHGPPLIGTALLLDRLLRRFYVPSFYSYVEIEPQGSSPLSDHLLSTERLDVIHHGASVSRIKKLEVISDWSATYKNLRVCADKERLKGAANCCNCHKCYRTMVTLSLLDSLSKYETFSSRLSIKSYLRWGFLTHLNVKQATKIRGLAIRTGRLWVAFLVQVAIVLATMKNIIIVLIKRLLSREQLYFIKRKIYSPESK